MSSDEFELLNEIPKGMDCQMKANDPFEYNNLSANQKRFFFRNSNSDPNSETQYVQQLIACQRESNEKLLTIFENKSNRILDLVEPKFNFNQLNQDLKTRIPRISLSEWFNTLDIPDEDLVILKKHSDWKKGKYEFFRFVERDDFKALGLSLPGQLILWNAVMKIRD